MSDDRQKISRRSYLGGIAGVSFYGLSSPTSEPKEEIVTARKDDEVLETRKVSKRWKKYTETLRTVLPKIKKNNLGKNPINGVGIIRL